MLRYAAWRALGLFPQLVLVSMAVFLAMSITPGDPVLMMLGPEASPAAIVQVRAELGLDQPLHRQYIRFLKGACHGDLGLAYLTRRPVAQSLGEVLPSTIELALISFVVAVIVGIPLGVVGATHRNSLMDNVIRVVSVAWFSIPVFWSALMLILVFAVWLKWLPAFGAGGAAHLVLPALSLALVSVGTIARMTRSSVLDVLREDYVNTARAKGLSERRVIRRHALRNAMVAIVTVLGLQFGSLLCGAVLSETVFARPGLGRFLVDAISARDYPSIRGAILLIAAIVIAVNLLTDLTYRVLDPRIRY